MKEREGVSAFPLAWPAGWAREKHPRHSPFFETKKNPLTVYNGYQQILDEMKKLVGCSGVVISTNVPLRSDGIPLSNARLAADDAGVAVYFRLHGEDRVLACDKWRSVAENLRAIARHVEAVRAQERWGVGTTEQAFRGFTALPEQASRERTWREVFDFPPDYTPSVALVTTAYRELARKRHPDHGGSDDAMAELSRAKEQALEEIEA